LILPKPEFFNRPFPKLEMLMDIPYSRNTKFVRCLVAFETSVYLDQIGLVYLIHMKWQNERFSEASMTPGDIRELNN
jgi:hypothetical protein